VINHLTALVFIFIRRISDVKAGRCWPQ